MTKEEYVQKMKENDEWAPGWEAIDAEFDRLYPGQEPAHYATTIESRTMFGGDEYLEGFSSSSCPWPLCVPNSFRIGFPNNCLP